MQPVRINMHIRITIEVTMEITIEVRINTATLSDFDVINAPSFMCVSSNSSAAVGGRLCTCS